MKNSSDKPTKLSSDIFIAVKHEDERNRVFTKIAENQEVLLGQLEDGQSLKLRIESYEFPYLYCRPSLDLAMETRLSFQFKYDHELYFAQFEVLPLSPGLVRLKPPGQIFRLQRRQSYRVRIPKEQGALFRMNSPFKGALPIIDISAGGFKAQAPATTETKKLKVDERVLGTIELGEDFEPLPVELLIRRIQELSDQAQYALGFQVVDPDQQVEMRLLSYVMRIFRVFYSYAPADKDEAE